MICAFNIAAVILIPPFVFLFLYDIHLTAAPLHESSMETLHLFDLPRLGCFFNPYFLI